MTDVDTMPRPEFSTSPPAKKSHKVLIAGVTAGVIIVGLGAVGAFAYNKLHSGDDYPFDHLASGAFFYAQTNIDPSANQKLAINKLAKKFPDLKDETGQKAFASENINGALIKEVINSESNFDWIGDRTAIAAYADDNDKDTNPELALLIQADDSESAEKGLKEILAKANERPTSKSNLEGAPTSERDLFVGKIYNDEWVAVTDGNLKTIFESDKTLADDKKFISSYDKIKGNVFSAWSNLNDFSSALKVDGDNTFDASGVVTVSLKAREDGLDLASKTTGLKWKNKTVAPSGDQGKTADLLGETSYDDAILNLGITGLGDLLKTTFENSTPNETFSLSDGVTPTMLPGLLGSNVAVSVKGSSLEDINLALKIEGTSKTDWETLLKTEGLTVETAESSVNSGLGLKTDLTINDTNVSLVIGSQPSGGGKFKDGFVTGSVDLDKLAVFFNNFTLFGETPSPYDGPKNIGEVKFFNSTNNNGDGNSSLSWTTPR